MTIGQKQEMITILVNRIRSIERCEMMSNPDALSAISFAINAIIKIEQTPTTSSKTSVSSE